MTKIQASTKKGNTRKTQKQRVLNLLIAGFKGKREIPLPEMMKCAAQYSARIHELRKDGWKISNRAEYHSGIKHTFFRLESPIQSADESQAAQHGGDLTDSRSAVRNGNSTEQANLLVIPEQPVRTWTDPEASR